MSAGSTGTHSMAGRASSQAGVSPQAASVSSPQSGSSAGSAGTHP